MKVAIYARVSTDDKNQNPETQLLALRQYCADSGWDVSREYIDYARAKDYKNRKQWAQLLKDANQHKFGCVLVFKLDRAWRHTREALNTLEDWEARGIKFKSLNDQYIDTTVPMGKVVLIIMLAIAEMESGTISQRVTAGIVRTKAQGNRYGRKTLKEKRGITPEHMTKALEEKKSVRSAAILLKCSRSTIIRTLGPEAVKKILEGVEKDR